MKRSNSQKGAVIIIPAFNEGKVIGGVVSDVLTNGIPASFAAEVVVVDDCSVDNTSDEARKAGATVIKHLMNLGAGGATATGLYYAKTRGADTVATMDADGQHLAKDVKRGLGIMARSRGTDLLVGSRLTANKTDMSKVKTLGNKLLTFITSLLFGVSSSDSQSGLRVFSKRAINNLTWDSDGYEFCSEMLWRAKQKGLVIDEFPITSVYTSYSVSKGQNNWNGINIVKALIKKRLREIFR